MTVKQFGISQSVYVVFYINKVPTIRFSGISAVQRRGDKWKYLCPSVYSDFYQDADHIFLTQQSAMEFIIKEEEKKNDNSFS